MTRITWRATAPDGIAHAFTTTPHALCGARNQPPRFDWPLLSHCLSCVVREKEVRAQRLAS